MTRAEFRHDPISFTPRFRSKKRVTPEEDFERLAERVWMRGRGKIRNKADFLSVYASYMRDSEQGRDVELREKAFDALQRRHSSVKRTVVTRKERVRIFMEAGDRPSPREFDVPSRVSGRTVFARQTFVTIKGRKKMVFRDKKGRFARPIKS